MWKSGPSIEDMVKKVRELYPKARCRIFGLGPEVIITDFNTLEDLGRYSSSAEKAWKSAYDTVKFN